MGVKAVLLLVYEIILCALIMLSSNSHTSSRPLKKKDFYEYGFKKNLFRDNVWHFIKGKPSDFTTKYIQYYPEKQIIRIEFCRELKHRAGIIGGMIIKNKEELDWVFSRLVFH